jgi:hypothetical protein
MFDLLTRWHPEDDPITRAQAETLALLLGGTLTESALEGFLIVAPRFVDEFGAHRTAELARIFRTDRPEGRRALLASLEHVRSRLGGMAAYEQRYPVSVIPPRPAFPQLKIIGIETIADRLYRVLDSRATAYPTSELISDHIVRTGRLPAVPRQRHPVRRTKPRFHWCSYDCWGSPDETRRALQILPEWSDCRLRALLLTTSVARSAYVAFNGDRNDPEDSRLRFYKYFYEPLAQDHPPYEGGGPQIAVDGAPRVELLEAWDEHAGGWRVAWSRYRRSV